MQVVGTFYESRNMSHKEIEVLAKLRKTNLYEGILTPIAAFASSAYTFYWFAALNVDRQHRATDHGMDKDFSTLINGLPNIIENHISSLQSNSAPVTANLHEIPSLPSLPSVGLGTAKTFSYLQSTILPSLAQGHAGPRYYGVHPNLSS